MDKNRKENASGQAGVSVVGGQVQATSQSKARYSGKDLINKILREIQFAGLWLKSTSGDTQLATFPKVLEYFGPRRLNTYEGTAAGYLRSDQYASALKEVE